jgi:hypothetical protein
VHILDGADLVAWAVPSTHLRDVQAEYPEDGRETGEEAGSEVELVPGAVSGPGVREWLASLGRLEVAGAAFDTRLQGLPAFTGRASKSIRRLLAHHGARIAASPESFLVEGLTGALAGGEPGRARAWGQRLSEVTASQAPPVRRQAS